MFIDEKAFQKLPKFIMPTTIVTILIAFFVTMGVLERTDIRNEQIKDQRTQQMQLQTKQMQIQYYDSLLKRVDTLALRKPDTRTISTSVTYLKERREAELLLNKLAQSLDNEEMRHFISDQLHEEIEAYNRESEYHQILVGLSGKSFGELCKGKLDTIIFQDNALNTLIMLKLYDERNLRGQILKQRAKEEKEAMASVARAERERLQNCSVHRVRLQCGRTSNNVAAGEYGSSGNVAYFMFERGVDVPCEEWVRVCCVPMGSGDGGGSDPAERMLNTYPWYRITGKP